MGHWWFKFKFGSMGYALLLLHVLIKCPEMNRNYLPVVLLTISIFSPYYFNAKLTTILPLTLKGALD